MSDKVPTYGYHKTEGAKIFHLEPGEALPKGWHDTPAKLDVVLDDKGAVVQHTHEPAPIGEAHANEPDGSPDEPAAPKAKGKAGRKSNAQKAAEAAAAKAAADKLNDGL